MKSFFKILTFLIFLIIILVFVGIMWDESPIATLYETISNYTNYIMWLFAIIGGVAIFLDLKNVKKIVLVLFFVAILAMTGYLFISINDFSELFGNTISSPLEIIKEGPLLFIVLHLLMPLSLILGPDFLGSELPTAFMVITALLSVFVGASGALLLTTRSINNMSKAARSFYVVSIVAFVVLCAVLFVKNSSGATLEDDFLATMSRLLMISITISFFSFIAFFTSNYGFDSILEDVSMDEADSIINKNVKDLYTHPTAVPVQPMNNQQGTPMNVSNVPIQPVASQPMQQPVFEDNPLPFATAQVKKSDVANNDSNQINQ